MSPTGRPSRRSQLEAAIAAQETLRGRVDDSVIDTALAVLRRELDELLSAVERQQQRKMATILFMDIVGSTRMIQGMDPEESMELLDTSLQVLAEPVRRHGGHVNRFMGDGFLAVFGLPAARENDPEMAVRAALEILAVSRERARALKTDRGIPSFQVRIGVNTGLVAAGGVTESDDTVMGSTVNLAARLETAADPGTVLLSSHTYQHIRGVFDLEPHSPVAARGFSEPVEAYRVLRVKPRAFRLPGRGVEGVETRMVGREKEESRIREIAAQLFEQKQLHFVTLCGPAGLGKSRFMEEFESWLDLQPVRVRLFKGRATLDETHSQPYALFRDLFALRFGILDDDPLERVKSKLSAGFDEFSIHADQPGWSEQAALFVGHLLGYDFSAESAIRESLDDPQALRDRALQYLEEIFRGIAADQPVVLFFDDLHWADESSLDGLLHLVEALAGSPVLVLALTRPELFERRPEWNRHAGFETISLEPLSRSESERLVGEILKKVEDIPESLPGMIAERSEGNPYYIEEIVRMLVEDGTLVKDEPVWHIRAERLGDFHIPPTLTGIIQARLDGLPARERLVLQQASVIGKVFWDAAVSSISRDQARPERPQAGLSRDLRSLVGREIILEHRPSAFSEAGEYLFKNALFREITYETVLLKERKRYHGLVADWLIAQHAGHAIDVNSLIGLHLQRAGKDSQAADYFRMAADTAAARYANEAAAGLYREALGLTGPSALELRFEICMGLENVLNLLGSRAEQEQVIQNLQQVAHQLADPGKIATVLRRKTWFLYWTSDFPAMLETARQAVAVSGEISAPALAQDAHYAMAWAYFQLQDFDRAWEQAGESLTLALQNGDRLGEGNSHNVLGLIGMTRGQYGQAYEHIAGFLRISRQINDRNRELTALNSMVVILVVLGDYAAAVDYAQQMLDLAREMNDRVIQGTAEVNLAWASSGRQDWQTAAEHIRLGVGQKRESRHIEALSESLYWEGHIHLGLGRLDEAEQAFRESLRFRRDLDQASLQAESLSGLCSVALARDDLGPAQELAGQILTHIARDANLIGTWEPLRIYWTVYRVLKAADDPRQSAFLEDSFENLQTRAASIPDESARQRYLENVPWNRAILAEWDLSHPRTVPGS